MDEFESPELEALPFEEICDYDCPPTPDSSDASDVVSLILCFTANRVAASRQWFTAAQLKDGALHPGGAAILSPTCVSVRNRSRAACSSFICFSELDENKILRCPPPLSLHHDLHQVEVTPDKNTVRGSWRSAWSKRNVFIVRKPFGVKK